MSLTYSCMAIMSNYSPKWYSLLHAFVFTDLADK